MHKMHNVRFKAVQMRYIIGMGCMEGGHVPHTDYVCFEAISERNTLMNFERN